MERKNLEGRVAAITGGSRGLGKAIALALASEGESIALAARDAAALSAAAEQVRSIGADVEVFQADVSDEAQVSGLEKDVLSRFGHVDILVNNAGINVRKPIEEFSLKEWNDVLSTNLTSAFLMCRAFLPQMRGRGYGRIINLTSIMSHVSIAGRTAYSASKAGLLGFTKALALEAASDGISVVAISPGPFATEMNTQLIQDPDMNREFLSRIPAGRWGEAHEIGKLACYLCSPEAAFITGTDILIDGGWTAQ
ncbi:MAG TPA: 3-oxoacyl-ACP reductase family protein [Bryobacteraceae bacterium]|nr:3-oxoacyl-ACP reductase family protein [Bryobacteraceae bacterium]